MTAPGHLRIIVETLLPSESGEAALEQVSCPALCAIYSPAIDAAVGRVLWA